MNLEHTDKATVSRQVTFADMGEFIQDTWKAPDKRLNQTLAVGSSMLQGGCEIIVDEAQHHPEKLAERAAANLAIGALFGAGMACELPAVAAIATAAGAIATGLWLGEVGHKLYTNSTIRRDLDQLWNTGSLKNRFELNQNLASDGRDLMFATTFGAAGFSAGSKLPGLLNSIKPLEFPPPNMTLNPALATACETRYATIRAKGNLGESDTKLAMTSNPFESAKSTPGSNKQHIEDVREIKDLIEKGDLEHADDCASWNRALLGAFDDVSPDRALTKASIIYEHVSDSLLQAKYSSADRKEMLLNQAQKLLDHLEKIDIEKAIDQSIRQEAQRLYDLCNEPFGHKKVRGEDRANGHDRADGHDQASGAETREPGPLDNILKPPSERERARSKDHDYDREREYEFEHEFGSDFGR